MDILEALQSLFIAVLELEELVSEAFSYNLFAVRLMRVKFSFDARSLYSITFHYGN